TTRPGKSPGLRRGPWPACTTSTPVMPARTCRSRDRELAITQPARSRAGIDAISGPTSRHGYAERPVPAWLRPGRSRPRPALGGSFARLPPAADYALLSPSVRHYGYGAPQRRASVAGRPRPGMVALKRAIGTRTHDPRRTSGAA